MYLPRVFQSANSALIERVIREYPFATLVVARISGPAEIAHLLVVFDPTSGARGSLRAHVAAANPLAELVATGAPATVIFHGPDAYVSPTWYEHPTEQVPTWNYAVIHAHGRLSGPASRE